MVNAEIIQLKNLGGSMGALTPIEGLKDIDFEIKRIYYITRVPEGVTRGFHAHSQLEQLLICVNGSVKIRLKTPYEEEIVTLDNSAVGLKVGKMLWREMFDFTEGAVLLVLASDYYDEEEYIRDYEEYIENAKNYFRKTEER